MAEAIHVIPKNSGSKYTVDIFGEKGLNNALKKLEWKIVDDNIVNDKDKPVKCSICNDALTESNLSAFFPNSLDQVCDKPECFISAISKAKKYET